MSQITPIIHGNSGAAQKQSVGDWSDLKKYFQSGVSANNSMMVASKEVTHGKTFIGNSVDAKRREKSTIGTTRHPGSLEIYDEVHLTLSYNF